MQEIVGVEHMSKLKQKFLLGMLKKMGATQCPKCHESWVHEAGKVDYKQKDDKGAVLTKYRKANVD